MKFTQSTKSFDIIAGYKIMEIDAPSTFCGKSLKELNLKALYRIDILFIKRKYPPQSIPIPSANEIIKEGDRLVVAGLSDNLTKIIQKGL
ncbi:MAG: TrkA C-terminal domain-containing protein [Acidobacteriota bacterium]|nr:TrkA C-terminal domain-containing protein [Acidobacteriota bacterium]